MRKHSSPEKNFRFIFSLCLITLNNLRFKVCYFSECHDRKTSIVNNS